MIYISDLDGTLLNNNSELSKYSLKVINEIKEKNIKFTIATARSIYTAKEIIEKLDLAYPCILRNGAVIYDPNKEKIIYEKVMDFKLAMEIINDLKAYNLRPIVHYKKNKDEYVDYTKISNKGEKYYIESRLSKNDERFKKTIKYNYDNSCSFVSICSIEKTHNEYLKLFMKKYKNKCEIHCYEDNYTKYSWLEFNCFNANKKTACEFLVSYLEEDKYIAFGDGENDIGMLENAHEAFVPKNSYLYNTDGNYKVIDSNENDGVAVYLKNNLFVK